MCIGIPRLDKTKITRTTLQDDSGDREYWLTKTPAERMLALEQMRQIVYGYDPSTARFQRVLEITRQTLG